MNQHLVSAHVLCPMSLVPCALHLYGGTGEELQVNDLGGVRGTEGPTCCLVAHADSHRREQGGGLSSAWGKAGSQGRLSRGGDIWTGSYIPKVGAWSRWQTHLEQEPRWVGMWDMCGEQSSWDRMGPS